ncbi:MAG: hypothetical protein V4727_09845 [Verrucomicrobiota bacterium]
MANFDKKNPDSQLMAIPETSNSAFVSIGIESGDVTIRIDLLVLGLLIGCLCLWFWSKRKLHSSFSTEISEVTLKFGSLPEAKIKINRDTQKIAFAAYAELVTRKIALPFDEEHDLISEVYSSWYQFFGITRELIKQVPAHHIAGSTDTRELVQALIDLLNVGLRPHLTKWRAKYRRWHDETIDLPENKTLSPQEIQKKFPFYEHLISDIKSLNGDFQKFAKQLRMLAEGRENLSSDPSKL